MTDEYFLDAISVTEVGLSGNKVNEETDEDLSKKSDGSPPRPHHLMTTKELQLYWIKEKYGDLPEKLLFQIKSARIAEDFLSKFVMYQIVIIKTGSFDQKRVSIERRYSDFERLHRNLLKDFNNEMEDIVFPKKILIGNLNEEMINKRMIALKEYLEELYAIRCVRNSKKYIDFFINPELEESYNCIRGGQYVRATQLLQQILGLQEKLAKDHPTTKVPTLCALVVCHKDMDQFQEAYEVGLQALELIQKHPRHKYYAALLDILITIAYKLGKEFQFLREKLEVQERMGSRGFEGEMTLKEIVVQEWVHAE
ncbi:sorting nexin-20 isoform X2 [Hyperolius riggenbachi]|uniref:sorting nexin-20 isoform X2 n=1 Tax=Hyperolius riggenbachi TaxID=752182 RepID=UPI0035A275F8